METFYAVRDGDVEVLYGDGWIAEAIDNDYLLYDSPEEAIESMGEEDGGRED